MILIREGREGTRRKEENLFSLRYLRIKHRNVTILSQYAIRNTQYAIRNTQYATTMLIAKVIGTVVSTIKHPSYYHHKLLVIQPLHLPGQEDERDFLAVDVAQAGIGDTVLVNQEGGGARIALNDPKSPVISLIVGVLDSVDLPERVARS